MSSEIRVPEEIILGNIHEIRGQKGMLDSDLAELYQMETRVLNQAFKTFPYDFIFELSQEE